jgi:Transposase/Helix-turn-helix domain of transposase family ISL3/zinc-finger of transposase IS204/IS1001/IS1096/IS1165
VGQHSSASATRLLGLDDFKVVAIQVTDGEWQLSVETVATVVGCHGCGVRAELHGRRRVRVRDLPLGGRPVVLCWRKRIWRCGEPACRVRTWTERVAAIRPRAVLTERARAEACRRVGKDAHAVAAVARDLGVGWATIMRAVHEHGTPLVDDAARLEGVTALGLDETSFLRATPTAPTRWVTGLVDLERGRLLDLVADRTRAAVDGWLGARPHDWLTQVGTVALDPWRGYASALRAPLGHATVVVDHFHAIRLANTVVDQVRRRMQQATLGIGAASVTRCTGSASCCSLPQSSSPGGDGYGCGPAWRLEIPPARSPRPGRAKSCCEPSMPRSARRPPGPRWSASTAGRMASRSLSCPGWLALCGRGRPRSSPGMPQAAAPTAPPRR